MTRSAGHSAVGLASYMGAARKKGSDDIVGALEVVGAGESDPLAFAAALDAQEARKNSRVGRHLILALPKELNDAQRAQLVRGFALHLRDTFDLPSLTAVHRGPKENPDNFHAHLLLGTRRLNDGKKAREFDDERGVRTVYAIRQAWGERVNAALAAAGRVERVDHRNKRAVAAAAQRIAEPTRDVLGPKDTHALRYGRTKRAEELRQKHEQYRETARTIDACNAALADAATRRASASLGAYEPEDLRAGRRALEGRRALQEWANTGRGAGDGGRARKAHGPRH